MGRRNDVLHFLGHDHGLTEKLSDGLERGTGDSSAIPWPCLMAFQASSNNIILRIPFNLSHFVDEGFHDDNGDYREEYFVVLDIVQLEDYKPFTL